MGDDLSPSLSSSSQHAWPKARTFQLLKRPACSGSKLTFGSVCSGYESVALALQGMGIEFDFIFAADSDRDCQAALAHNYDISFIGGDIWQHSLSHFPKTDLFAAGFPCQPISRAGLGRGIEVPQGQVIFRIMELIQLRRFPCVLLENVEGLYDALHKDLLTYILSKLQLLGYETSHKLINAETCGLPQHRKRVFIVAIQKTRLGTRKMTWPKPLPKKANIASFLDPKTEKEKRMNLDKNLPPRSQGTARHNMLTLHKQLRAVNLRPSQTMIIADIDGSKLQMMYNRCPCITKTRATSGFWVCPRGRRMSTQEMKRLMGIGIRVPRGGKRIKIIKPPNIDVKKWRGMIGNSMPINVLQRILARMLPVAKLSNRTVADLDFWDRAQCARSARI